MNVANEKETKRRTPSSGWMFLYFFQVQCYIHLWIVFSCSPFARTARKRERKQAVPASDTWGAQHNVHLHTSGNTLKISSSRFSLAVCASAREPILHTRPTDSRFLCIKKNNNRFWVSPTEWDVCVCVCVCVAAFNKTRYMTGRGNERLGEMLWSPGRGETIFIVQFKQRYGDWKIIIIISI